MRKVLVLGAAGQIARWVIEMLGGSEDIELTLYLRHARKLKGKTPSNAKVVEGDVLDRKTLDPAVRGQDVIYANLTGDDIDQQASNIIASMQDAGVKRLALHRVPGHLRRGSRKVRRMEPAKHRCLS